ncbi:nucleolar protein dao-5-like isoform X2 [Palaemon carinicauda]|uniref:nucleolar protein dao-5-like isoform X2 n=1 Tax=Palaemon carinicauda TaxID=392227 RepID=UPI0035B6868C
MAATDTKCSSSSPPLSPTSPTPSLVSPEGDSLDQDKDSHQFKSNLQIFLKRQENELTKNFQFKKKLEEEEMEKRKEKVETKGKHESDNNERKVSDKYETENAESDDEVFEDHIESKVKPTAKENTDKNRKNESVDKDKGHVSQKKEKDKGSTNSQSVKDQPVRAKPLEEKDKATENIDKAVAEKVTPDKERTKEGINPTHSKKEEKEEKKKLTSETEVKKVLPEKKDISNEEKSSPTKTQDQPSKAKDTPREKLKTGKPEDNTKEENDTKLGSPRKTSPLSPDISVPSENAPRNRKDAIESPDIGHSKKQKHQGTLMKKGSSPFSLWKKYYFVLDGKLLMYYRSDSDYKGLAGAKGSLDLTPLEDVKIKKPGKTKAPFPFGLYMKNPKTVNLAAETTEEREKWMAILLGTKRHGTRLSGSDSALKTEDSPVQEAKHKKYATMPAGNMPPNTEDSSSDSESDDKKEEEEEPKFIQPKKVTRVAIGLPIDIGSVKLKKVSENPKKVEKPTEPENPVLESEVFGVKLKKLSVGGTTDSNIEGKSNSTEKNASSRRPSKQAVIPLNKSPLLPRVDIETDQKSLNCKPSGSTERKRSPSPCIPLSKGVHAFISKSTDEEKEKESTNELIVYTAESREIRYSEDALSIEDDPDVEFLEALDEIKKSLENLEFAGEENLQKSDNREHQDIAEIPQVSVTLKENPEESEYEEFDKEFLRTIKENKNAELFQRESGKFNKENHTEINESGSDGEDNITERSEKELVANADKISETYPSESTINTIQTSSLAKHGHESNEEEENKELLKHVSNPPMVSEAGEKESSEVLTSPSGRVPDCSQGQTSSNSSCKSDSENSDKKSGKFKIFQTKQSVSGNDEKPKDEKKDCKERERKKSSFSKFLPGKKSKVKKCKDGDEGLERSPLVSSSSGKENVECNNEQNTLPNDETSLKEKNLDHDENQGTTELNIPQISLSFEDSDSESTKKVELRSRKHSEREEARSSTYCRSSYTSESEPPPLVPEKKGMRSMSPGHDVPQNNRPVTAQEHEEVVILVERKEDIKVDGVISLDQIDAILSAKDNREKRRKSGCQDSGEKIEGSFGRMSSVVSTTSIESDEPLPKFNFLSSTSNRSSSGSSKNRDRSDDSDISSDTQTDSARTTADTNEQELSVSLRQIPRLTESIHAGRRVSLTFPEYTVIEEDGCGTPDQVKSIVEVKSENTPEREEDEIKDYFPVIGGGVKLRNRSPTKISSQSSEAGLRTSGINSLKAFLEENQEEESSSTRSGISRLGHSAAVEKLKRESAEE